MSLSESVKHVDGLHAYNLDRSSLDDLLSIVAELREQDEFDHANKISGALADPAEIRLFVETIFRRATEGFVQLRMFIDGADQRTYRYSEWQGIPVTDVDRIVTEATRLASTAAASIHPVNFCPPVTTLDNETSAKLENLQQGVAVMVECDEHPVSSRELMESILGTATLVIRSGGIWRDPVTGTAQDKLHVYWRLASPANTTDEHAAARQARILATRIVAADPTATPSVHPCRWPGSWHRKSHPRLASIVECNPDREVELPDVLAILTAEAEKRGIRTDVTADDVPVNRDPGLKLDSDVWQLERDSQHIADKYLSMSNERHHGLHSVAVSIAMSALNKGYDISSSELADIAADLQRQNPSGSLYTSRELDHLGNDALSIAHQNVGDDAAYKKIKPETPDTPNVLDDPPGGYEAFKKKDHAQPSEDHTMNDQRPRRKTRLQPNAEYAYLWPSADDDRNTKPPTWIIRDLIPENSDVLLFGPSGWLKSFAVLELLYSTVSGTPFLAANEVLKTGPALYWCGEGYDGLRTKRRAAWEIAHGFESFSFNTVRFCKTTPVLTDQELTDQYIQGAMSVLNGEDCNLFVVDTYNRALNGLQESDAGVAAKYLNMCRDIREHIGGTSLTIHHTGLDGSRPRGSTALWAGYDVVIFLRKHQMSEDGVHTIELFVDKMKEDEAGKSYFAQSEKIDTGTHGTSLVLRPCTEDQAKQAFANSVATGVAEQPARRSGVSTDELERGIRTIKPYGGIVATNELSDMIAHLSAEPNRRKATSVLAYITGRCKKAGDKFFRYRLKNGGWGIPGELIEDPPESPLDQMRVAENGCIFTN